MRGASTSASFCLAMLLTVASPLAAAQYTIQPAHPKTTDTIRVAMEFHAPCDGRRGSATVDSVARKVQIKIESPDTCNLNDPDDTNPERFIEVGTLAAGTWTFEFTICGFVLPPQPRCTLFRIDRLLVQAASGARFVVPASSTAALVLIIVGIVVGATAGAQRRSS
jgi:hypothetical protein